jgi:hypothetical protein
MVVAHVLDLFAIMVEMVDLYAIVIKLISQTLVQNLGAIHKEINVVALWKRLWWTLKRVVIWLFGRFIMC